MPNSREASLGPAPPPCAHRSGTRHALTVSLRGAISQEPAEACPKGPGWMEVPGVRVVGILFRFF